MNQASYSIYGIYSAIQVYNTVHVLHVFKYEYIFVYIRVWNKYSNAYKYSTENNDFLFKNK